MKCWRAWCLSDDWEVWMSRLWWRPLTFHACDRASIMGWYQCYTELAGLMSDRHRVGDLFA